MLHALHEKGLLWEPAFTPQELQVGLDSFLAGCWPPVAVLHCSMQCIALRWAAPRRPRLCALQDG